MCWPKKTLSRAHGVGACARSRLKALSKRHECIGDVRGSGLFFGAEMVLDRQTKQPATAFTKKLANEMRREGVLINFVGIRYNVLKIRPNIQFTRENADVLIDTLDAVLARVPLQ